MCIGQNSLVSARNTFLLLNVVTIWRQKGEAAQLRNIEIEIEIEIIIIISGKRLPLIRIRSLTYYTNLNSCSTPSYLLAHIYSSPHLYLNHLSTSTSTSTSPPPSCSILPPHPPYDPKASPCNRVGVPIKDVERPFPNDLISRLTWEYTMVFYHIPVPFRAAQSAFDGSQVLSRISEFILQQHIFLLIFQLCIPDNNLLPNCHSMY